MVRHGGSSAGSYLADPTSPIPSHCASIVVTSTLTVKHSTQKLPLCIWIIAYKFPFPFPGFVETPTHQQTVRSVQMAVWLVGGDLSHHRVQVLLLRIGKSWRSPSRSRSNVKQKASSSRQSGQKQDG